jgi:hypothetical protein
VSPRLLLVPVTYKSSRTPIPPALTNLTSPYLRLDTHVGRKHSGARALRGELCCCMPPKPSRPISLLCVHLLRIKPPSIESCSLLLTFAHIYSIYTLPLTLALSLHSANVGFVSSTLNQTNLCNKIRATATPSLDPVDGLQN